MTRLERAELAADPDLERLDLDDQAGSRFAGWPAGDRLDQGCPTRNQPCAGADRAVGIWCSGGYVYPPIAALGLEGDGVIS